MNKILFLDRDGVVNIDFGHVYKKEEFVFMDGIFDLTKRYQDLGYKIAIITNQAGIAKKLYTLSDLLVLNEYIINQFLEKGIKLSGIYFCPHKDEDNCECRKPKPGLFIKALEELAGDKENSLMIGDKMSDLEAAYRAGILNLIFLKGSYEEKEVEFSYKRINSLKEI